MTVLRPHIVIIGAGQLGSRHLQGLTRMKQAINVTVIEPNPAALDVAKKRYDEMPSNPLIGSISFSSTIEALEGDVDVAIIATNADVRKNVIEYLFSVTVVKYMILEKVAFQSIVDFQVVLQLLESNNTKAWVNCSKRMHSFFKTLKTVLNLESRIQVRLEGGNWGLASNAIHMIDLFAFLTGEMLFSLNSSGLATKVYQSKRNGFIELGGVIEVNNSNGDQLTLIDEKESTGQIVLSISSRNHRYKINYSDGKIFSAHREDGWEEKEELFQIPLQSELTHLVVQQILDTGQCDITPIKESYVFHKPMLEAFNIHLSKLNGVKYEACPIT